MLQCSVPPAPAMTSFVVTSADGERFIGVAVNFYEPTSTPLGRAARTPNNHDNGSDGDSDSDSSPQRAIALSPTCGPPASWFAAKAIVLLTKWCVCSMRHWQLWVRSWWLWFVDIIAGAWGCVHRNLCVQAVRADTVPLAVRAVPPACVRSARHASLPVQFAIRSPDTATITNPRPVLHRRGENSYHDHGLCAQRVGSHVSSARCYSFQVMLSLLRPPINAVPVAVESDCIKLLFHLLDADNVVKVRRGRSRRANGNVTIVVAPTPLRSCGFVVSCWVFFSGQVHLGCACTG